MTVLSIRGHAWAVAVLVFAAAIAADAVQSSLPCGTGDVTHSLQFATDSSVVQNVAPPGSAIRAAALAAQRLDTRILVPGYWLLFAGAGLLLWRTRGRIDRGAGTVVIALATGAALFDFLENRIIVAALTDGAPFRSAALWATVKWALVFAATLALALPFLARLKIPHQSRPLAVMTGLVLMAGGLIGSSVWRGDGWIAAALATIAIGLLLMALLFLWDPEYLDEAS
jgi:hypothetical protein